MDVTPRKPKEKFSPAGKLGKNVVQQSSGFSPVTPRRSLRLSTAARTPCKDVKPEARKPRCKLKLAPETPDLPKSKKLRSYLSPASRRVYYKKVVYDGGEFSAGDDVYVKRQEGAESDCEEEPEYEECRVCFRVEGGVMVECDDCLGGFHLQCVRPPLEGIPEGDWICEFCEGRRNGKPVELPRPPDGRKVARTAKERLLASHLWAARIESLWRLDGCYSARVRWYIIPEETAAGRRPHNLRRELYRTNEFSDIEMECILRHCMVLSPKDFRDANDEGDDVFYCEYEYDVHLHNFKRLEDVVDDVNENKDFDSDYGLDYVADSCSDTNHSDSEDPNMSYRRGRKHTRELAANSRNRRIHGLQKIGISKIPEYVRCRKQTDLEKAKAMLLLATLPKSLPCRDKEMEEITSFLKDAICDDKCLGRCLYIHGVPGTGKTMSVLAVARNLCSEVDSGALRPYCFIEINGLKLSTPENIYKAIYEQLTGHRVGWKKALHYLTEHFSKNVNIGKQTNRPIVLLIDELDLLLTRNQSVLYNILDWPAKPNSKLIVIGVANTMDLPEKLLPRISSRLGIQRLCFGPYNYRQLQEIILSRLKGIEVFEEQAVEFASRKVAAMSGDARRALEICRRAAELADFRLKQSQMDGKPSHLSSDSKSTSVVGMADVEVAIQEIFQAPHIQVMKTCCKLAKIVLVSMVHDLYKTGLGEITFEKVAFTVVSFCWTNGEALPGYDTIWRTCCKLCECKILLNEEGPKQKFQKLQLNYPSDDVVFALKDCSQVPWLSKYL